MISPVGEGPVTYRLPSSFTLDVLGARLRLGEHRRHDVVRSLKPVLADKVAPTLAEVDRISPWCRLDERPAQLGNIFNTPSWPGLLPIDQSYGDAVLDHDVSGLQIVVDYALETFNESRSEVVKLPHDAREQAQIDLTTRRRRLSGNPGEHLPFFFIDTQVARRPRDTCGLETAQDPLNQGSVLILGASDRVANADWAVHEDSVAQQAIGDGLG